MITKRFLLNTEAKVNYSLYFCLQLGKTPLQLASRGSFVAIVDMIIKAERYYAVARVNIGLQCNLCDLKNI